MTAIATSNFRKFISDLLFDVVSNQTNSNIYHIGIGKADAYGLTDTPPTTLNTLREQRIARANLQAVKQVAGVSYVTTRIDWTSGTNYTAYNDYQEGIPADPYYVFTELNEVYICLKAGPGPSVVFPSYTTISGATQTAPFATSDGYVWKYLYTVSGAEALLYLSSNFMPVKKVVTATTPTETDQKVVQDAAIGGQILGAVITNGGSGYLPGNPPTVVFDGDGTGAAATAVVSNGAVIGITMNNYTTALGSGYSYASISLVGGDGTGAAARPIVGPLDGIGADPRDDLKASSIMFNARPDGNENDTFVTDNDFRQITLFRNMLEQGTSNILTEITANALRTLALNENAEALFTTDNILVGTNSGARAYIDKLDAGLIYYHQNEDTGFVPFEVGESVTEEGGSGEGTISTVTTTNVANAFSGDLLYIENRGRVVRSDDQQEDIKIVITF